MRYDDFRRSDDIEDRRDDSGGGFGGGGGLGLPIGGGGLGIGTIIVLGIVGYAFGIDPRILIGGAEILTGGGSQAPTYQTDRRSGTVKRGAPTDEMGSMISGILGEIDDRWTEIFQAAGQTYTGPKIVLFRNSTNGGRCGMAQSKPDSTAVRARPASSPRPISSRMKPGITCRTCWASCRA
jgi:predicted metalloprotease